jgi:hypothetical protein
MFYIKIERALVAKVFGKSLVKQNPSKEEKANLTEMNEFLRGKVYLFFIFPLPPSRNSFKFNN